MIESVVYVRYIRWRVFPIGCINGDRDNNLNRDGYVISLNGVKAFRVKELDRDDPFLKNMPMVNNWSKYYIAKRFQKLNRDKLILNFKSDTFGEDNLSL